MRPVLRDRLAAGETVTGLILFSASPMILEVAAAAGVDFVIIDMEHTAVDMDRVGHLIRAADAAGMTPFVRVPNPDAALIKKLLNLGAVGICLPHADRAGCEQTLRAVRYAPQGDRGACAIVRSAGYAPGDWDAYTARANRDVMVIPLLEDKAAIDDFEAMCGLDGIDVFFIGPTDLSIALGVPHATFDEPRMGAALEKVVAAARRRGKYVMTTIGNKPDAAYGRSVRDRGVQAVVLGTDGHLFLDICRRLNAIKIRA
jgi:4-hydroxy-2-oxoheptanedioate aldolase